MFELFYFLYLGISTLFLFNHVSKILDFLYFDVLTLFLFNQMFNFYFLFIFYPIKAYYDI